MFRKLVFLLVAIICSIGICKASTVTDSGKCGDNLYWWYYDDGALVIYGTGAMKDYSYENYVSTAPWYKYRESITSVSYNNQDTSNRLTHIGDWAFYNCKKITSVDNILTSTVTSIGDAAFDGCVAITSVAIPNSVTSIGTKAFKDCNALASVTLSSSLQTIGDNAFQSCTKLTSITIPQTVTSIGSYAFYTCSSLTTLTIEDAATDIGDHAFAEATKLSSINFGSNLTSIGESAFYNCNGLTSVTIPNSVTSIGQSAFSTCDNLNTVTVGTSVASIGSQAFDDCYILSTVNWNAVNCADFDSAPFYSVYNLTLGDAVEHIPAYLCKTQTRLTSITLPASVKSIGNSAFYECTGLKSITLPASVTSIGNSAFYKCTGLTSIEIPSSVTSMGTSVFNDCSGLKTVVWDAANCADFTSAETSPFNNLSGITSFTLGNDVAYIPAYLFSNLSSITSLTIPSSVTGVSTTAFSSCPTITSFVWDAANFANFASAEASPFYNRTDITSFTFGSDVLHIPAYLCYGVDEMLSVTVPANVTSIGTNAFYQLLNINYTGSATGANWGARFLNKYVDGILVYEDNTKTALVGCAYKATGTIGIPATVTSVADNTFSNCTGITAVTVPSSVATMGSTVFSGCTSLATVTWDAASCADFASASVAPFNGLTGITSFTIGTDVLSIPAYLCYGLSYLRELTVPSTVTSIGTDAFNAFLNITYPGTATGHPWGARFVNKYVDDLLVYENNEKKTLIGCAYEKSGNVEIPTTVTSISDNAFSGCTLLTSVAWNAINCADFTSVETAPFCNLSGITAFTFGSTVQHIPAYLCYGKTGLTAVTLPSTLTSIGSNAFYGCTGLTSIEIPSTLTSIGSNAFYGCTGLTSIEIPSDLTSIGTSVFTGCTGLTSVAWNVVDYADFTSVETAPFYNLSGITTFTFGSTVKHIPAYLCYGKTGLTAVTLPGTLTSIGSNAFYGCTGLTSIEIPSTLTSIGSNAFYGCTSLTSIEIPSTVTSIGTSAFSGCTGLTSVAWNVVDYADFTSVETAPFYNLSGITTFTFGSTVKHIPAYLCYGKTGLTAVTLPSTLSSIGSNAFYGCTGLTSIEIPSAVTSIGTSVFTGCTGLTSVVWNAIDYADFTSVETAPFYNLSGITTFTFGSSVQHIPAYLCYGKTGLNAMEIPSTVTGIGDAAFTGCTGLTTISIPDATTNMGDLVFYNCTGLTSATIGSAVTSLGERVFANCSKISTIVIPNSVTTIGHEAFGDCTGITSLTMGTAVKTIGDGAFSRCSGITTVTIPCSVTSIGGYAFYDCTGLTAVHSERTTPPALTAHIYNCGTAALYVPYGSSANYQSSAYWDDFASISEESSTAGDSYTLTDGTAYSSTIAKEYAAFTYTRTVYDNDWNLVYVPFAMNVEEMNNTHNIQLYTVNMFHCYDDDNDGTIDRTTIEVVKATSGETRPNHPYMMKYTGDLTSEEQSSGKTISILMSNTILAASEENPTTMQSLYYTYNIMGTYHSIASASAIAGNYYTLGTNSVGQVQFGKANGDIKPQRWYYTITDNESQLTLNPQSSPARIVIQGEETTGIDAIEADAEVMGIYTIDGQKVDNVIPGTICIKRFSDGSSKKVFIKKY